MSLLALLRKELRWSRRRLVLLSFLFVALPVLLAYGTLAFETVLPTDTAVAIVPKTVATTDADLSVARGAILPFSDPVRYESKAAALRALSREQVYAVVSVPADIQDQTTTATFTVHVHGSTVPYLEPSKLVVSVMDYVLNSATDAGIEVERRVVGAERSLSEYLVPTFLLVLVMVLAMVYLPYDLTSEAAAVDRIRLESSIEAMVVGKLAVFGALLIVPLAVFHVAALRFGYDVSTASVGAVAVYVLTFLYLGAAAAAVTVATRFSTFGRLVNVVALFALLTVSGIVYPAGFFSPVRREVVRVLPTHYSTIMARGFLLRDADLGLYADWLVGLVALTAVSLGAVKLSATVYERRA